MKIKNLLLVIALAFCTCLQANATLHRSDLTRLSEVTAILLPAITITDSTQLLVINQTPYPYVIVFGYNYYRTIDANYYGYIPAVPSGFYSDIRVYSSPGFYYYYLITPTETHFSLRDAPMFYDVTIASPTTLIISETAL